MDNERVDATEPGHAAAMVATTVTMLTERNAQRYVKSLQDIALECPKAAVPAAVKTLSLLYMADAVACGTGVADDINVLEAYGGKAWGWVCNEICMYGLPNNREPSGE